MAIREKTKRPKIIVRNFYVVARHNNPALRWCAVGADVEIRPTGNGAVQASTFGLDPAGPPSVDPVAAIMNLYTREGFHSIQIVKELAPSEE